jgi:hypothetical protein
MNKNDFCSFCKKKMLSMLSIAYFSLLTIFCKIGYMFFPSQVHIFFLGRIANVCSVRAESPCVVSNSCNLHDV